VSRTPAALTPAILAAHRSGALVAVELGASAGLLARRPAGYELRATDGAPGAARAAGVSRPGTALIQIRGVMTSYEEPFACGEAPYYGEICERYCAAHADPGVGSLLIDCDSNGGDVPVLEESIETMRAARAASGKLVVGYVGARCMSAGVWLLSGICDVIFCHPSSRMGSVGVLIGHETDARKATADGIDRTIVRDPPGKANPNPVEVLDDLGRGRMQELVSESRDRFVAQLAAFRGLDSAAILAWNGGTFSGPAAVAAGLADGLGSLASSLDYAAAMTAASGAT
jgi:ClpP class serine protease